jgi:hypothetical protein
MKADSGGQRLRQLVLTLAEVGKARGKAAQKPFSDREITRATVASGAFLILIESLR